MITYFVFEWNRNFQIFGSCVFTKIRFDSVSGIFVFPDFPAYLYGRRAFLAASVLTEACASDTLAGSGSGCEERGTRSEPRSGAPEETSGGRFEGKAACGPPQ